MPSTISFRFYSVERDHETVPLLKQALTEIAELSHDQRARQLAVGMVVRLERFKVEGEELSGEFIRVRETDFPFEVHDDGVRRLQTDGPLGMGIAFRFRPADSTLVIQYDPRIVSPGRAFEYLRQRDESYSYSIKPKLDPENWRKFNTHPIRKLRVKIASPQHLGEIENDGAMVKSSIQDLAHAYGAPEVTLELGMGRRKGALSATAHGLAQAVAKLWQNDEADLRSLKGWVKADDDAPPEEIDLIDEILSERTEFPSPKNDPEKNYEVRKNLARKSLRAHGTK